MMPTDSSTAILPAPAAKSRVAFVHEMFLERAYAAPERIAIEAAGHSLTFRQLRLQMFRLIDMYSNAGVARHDRIAVFSDDQMVLIPAILAALASGAVFIPLPSDVPDERLVSMLEVSSPHWILTDNSGNVRTSRLIRQLANPPRILHGETGALYQEPWRDWVNGEFDARIPRELDGNDPCYIYFTSGSTGRPKAILGRLKAIDHFIRWELKACGIPDDVRASQLIAPSFDAFLRDICVPLSAGGTICIPPSKDMVFDGRLLLNWIERERISLMHCVPSLFRALLNELSDARQVRSLRHVLLSGEPLYPADLQKWVGLCGDRVQIVNLYGPSETTMVKFAYFIKPGDETRPFIPIGKPIAGCSALLLDEQGKPCPRGLTGEVYIRTPYRSLGYFGQPELTREVFVPNPFNNDPSDLLYKTGDLARVGESGDYEFLGRRDRQVKIRGVRIELDEIEAALAATGLVQSCAVVLKGGASGDKAIAAYVVLKHNDGLEELRQQIRGTLALYMTPSIFVVLDAMPRLPNGKLDRRALPEPQTSEALTLDAQAPQGPIEEILAGIWAEVLDLKSVPDQANFFDLGGHSLLATRLMNRIRSAFACDLSLRAFFEDPTIAGLARRLKQESRHTYHPIVRRTNENRACLSYQQRRLWFLHRMEPDSPAYNLCSAVRVQGTLDAAALECAINQVIQRHEILRTSFQLDASGSPEQVIVPEVSIRIPVVDLDDWAEEEKEAELANIAGEEANRPFDLSRAPLLRVIMLQLAAGEQAVLLTMHHIISDGWSQGLLVGEIGQFYRAYTSGKQAAFQDLTVQYGDYAEWQEQQLSAESLGSQLEYWRKQLEGTSGVLDLPFDNPRPARINYGGSRHTFAVESALTGRLKDLARRENATLHMVVLAAAQLLLSRLSGQFDISIGSPIANRTRGETESLIGLFVNTLVMRTQINPAENFVGLLRRVREATLGAYAHQDLPFEKLVSELHPQRDLSRTPLFQVMLAFQNTPRGVLNWPGLEIGFFDPGKSVAKFDLTFFIQEDSDTLNIAIEYSTALFQESTIHRMARNWQTLLEAIVSDPEERVCELSLMTAAERDQVLIEWNNTSRDCPAETISELFEAQAARAPDSIALRYGSRQLTYAELDQRSNQLARELRKRGVQSDQIVGVCMERGPELLVAFLGVLKAGAAYVPLDPQYPAERLQHMMNDAAVRLLLTQEHLLVSPLAGAWDLVVLDRDWQDISREPASRIPQIAAPENLAYVIYTSGSTGWPKGSMITQRGLTNYAVWAMQEYRPQDGSGAPLHTSIAFDLTVTSIYPPLLAGSNIECSSAGLAFSELGGFLKAPAPFSLLKLTPAHLEILARQLADGDYTDRARALVIGGDALHYETLAPWRMNSRSTRLINEYGPTETVVGCCTYEVQPQDPFTGPVPIGRPIANTRMYVLDGNLNPVPPGVHGEIYIAGAGLARGYLGQPTVTAASFVPDPFSGKPGARMYKTGDRGKYSPTGVLQYLGRTDRQVKIRGHRIELGEIESALLQLHGVREAAVRVHTDSTGQKNLIGYMVTDEAVASPDTQAVKNHLRHRLPEYMVPATIVRLPEMPLTLNGKLDLKALPDAEISPRAGALLPADELELRLARIWEDLLHVYPVGRRDNFFELGGHSFLALTLMSKIEEEFGYKVPVSVLFEQPTIEHLAGSLRGQVPIRRSHLVRIQDKGSKPPLFFVHAISGGALCYLPLSRSMGEDQPFFGLQGMSSEDHKRVISIEERATDYVEAIREIAPAGPYMLGGWSFGGYVAFEMARQLGAAGEEVSLLVLLDIEAQGFSGKPPDRRDDAELLLEIAQSGVSMEDVVLESALNAMRISRHRSVEGLLKLLVNAGAVHAGVDISQVEQFLAGYRHRSLSLREYELRPYSGRIHLVRTLDRGPDGSSATVPSDPAMGWGALTPYPVVIHEVNSTHHNMIYPPHSKQLAEIFTRCISEAADHLAKRRELAFSLVDKASSC